MVVIEDTDRIDPRAYDVAQTKHETDLANHLKQHKTYEFHGFRRDEPHKAVYTHKTTNLEFRLDLDIVSERDITDLLSSGHSSVNRKARKSEVRRRILHRQIP